MKTTAFLSLMMLPFFLMGQPSALSCSAPKELDFKLLQEALDFKVQNRFRKDYSHVAIFDFSTSSWSEWESGNNTFVININDNGDVQHYKPNGTSEIYRRVSKIEEKYLDNGERYQTMSCLDEDGLRFELSLFDNSFLGLQMILSDGAIRFANP